MGFGYRRAQLCAAFFLLAFAPACIAQQLVVGSGARFSLGSSSVDAGCRDVQIAGILDIGSGSFAGLHDLSVPGSLNGGSGVVALSGDLAAAGGLVPQTGTVRIVDGCGSAESRLSGDHQFNRLSVQTSLAHELVLPAGGTQFIASSLELLGGAQRLVLRSITPGVVSFLSLAGSGTQTVNRVDAIDVGAPGTGQFLAPQAPEFYDSIDRGNTPRFLGEELVRPIPTLSVSGLLLLLIMIGGIALSQLRMSIRGEN